MSGENAFLKMLVSRKASWQLAYRTITGADSSYVDLSAKDAEISDEPIDVSLASTLRLRLRAANSAAQVDYKVVAWDKDENPGEVLLSGTLAVGSEVDGSGNYISEADSCDVWGNHFVQIFITSVTNISSDSIDVMVL